MANVQPRTITNAGVVYAPFIPILKVDFDYEARFKLDAYVLTFKLEERSMGVWKKLL